MLPEAAVELPSRVQTVRAALSREALLAFLSSTSGVDLSGVDADTTLGEAADSNRMRGSIASWIRRYGPDVRFVDLAYAAYDKRFAGTPEQLADHIETWLDAGVGGFNILPLSTLGSWDEIVDHAVPVLVARGLMQDSYAPGTLREKLFRRGPRLPESHPGRH